MPEDLQGLGDAIRASPDYYLGLAPLREVRDLIRRTRSPRQEFRLRLRVAWMLLRLGRTDEASSELDEAERLVEEHHLGREDRKLLIRNRALVLLRRGEETNCRDMHTPRSCIFPLTADGIHKDPRSAAAAIPLYEAYLALAPESRSARWLLNIAHMQNGTYPDAVAPRYLIPPSVFASARSPARFVDRAGILGVDRFDMAGGAAMEDFNGDGFLDLLATTSDPEGAGSLFLARGDGTFRDASQESGLASQPGALNLVQADYDNDGDVDVFLLRGAWHGEFGRWRNSLLRNRGDGTFEDVTREAGLAEPAYPTQTAAWGDYDGDGWLDLYIGNEAPIYKPGLPPYPSQLFRNRHDGTFVETTQEAGVVNSRYTKGVAWGDYDGDGALDLYVSNLGPNRLYHNRGDGTFEDVAPMLGVDEPRGRSFACWFWDYDNDGRLDLFVAGYDADLERVARSYLGEEVQDAARSRLYRNTGGGRFEDVTAQAGLSGVYLPMGANFGDFDGDGWLDIYLGTGDPSYETLTPNVALWNDAGRRFVDVTTSTGLGHLQKGHGIAFGDLDEDGDQDIFLQTGGFVPGDRFANALFENTGSSSSWITFRLVGVDSNRSAIGTLLRVEARSVDGLRALYRTVGSGGSFGASSLEQEIGLGEATGTVDLQVSWPRGRRQEFLALQRNRIYEIREDDPRARAIEPHRVTIGGHP